MKSVGASEANSSFADLLNRVAHGESITITRYGVPVAKLIPVNQPKAELSHMEIVEGMRQLRSRVKPGRMTVRDMVNEGRRF